MRRRIIALASAALLLAGCPSSEAPLELTAEGYPLGSLETFPGLALIPNIDDDNVDGEPDWSEAGRAAEDDDRSVFVLPATAWESVKANKGEWLRLDLGGDAGNIRITQEDVLILGEAEGPNRTSYNLTETDVDQVFEVEADQPLTITTATLYHLDEDGEVLASFTLWMTTGSMLLNHHLQQTEHVWVMDLSFGGGSYNNRHMVETYEDVLGEQFTAFSAQTYFGDVWIQDEVQFGWYGAKDQRIDVVIDSVRDRGLDNWPENNFDAIPGDGFVGGPDAIIGTWGRPQVANSLDSFGNLEVSPPLGDAYPFGRAYWGGDDNYHPAVEMTDHLADQLIQAPFRVDTSWLCVGHVDEFVSFVPDPSAPRGFRFVYSDASAAWEVLEGADNVELPKYRQSYGIDTIEEFVNDDAVRYFNEDLTEDVLDPILDRFIDKFDLTAEEIIPMPSLFEEPGGCGGTDAALIPGMANMIVANRGDRTDIFLADPFMRDSANSDIGQDEDPMIAFIEDTYPSGIDWHFVDNWSVYHLGLGEVHCGTNMTRTPNEEWWLTAGHLIEDEVLN